MVDIPVNELRSMSEAEINRIKQRLDEELAERRTNKRRVLIDDFKDSFNALIENGFTPHYYNNGNHDVNLTEVEHFYFDL